MSKSHVEIDPNDSGIAASPVIPAQLEGDHKFNFKCYQGISCFNACCKSIDITLTPYDVIRLKKRLGISAGEFLRDYAAPFEFKKDRLPGIKLRTADETTVCKFVTDEGCSVYEDRPTSCRYYPIGMVAMRRQDEYVDSSFYIEVKEDHCKGHEEDNGLTIDQYREEQGLIEYDEASRGWRQLLLKMDSAGPAIGAPSKRSRQLFWMANYDMDTFRAFILSDGFQTSFILEDDFIETLTTDDTALMNFGVRLVKQVMFGEQTIPLKDGAWDQWSEKKREELGRNGSVDYDAAAEPVEPT